MVVVDTLRADHLGAYGYERATSYRIDDWAEEGVIFEDAYSNSNWTLPAFGTLLTGLLPGGHQAGAAYFEDDRKRFSPLRDDVPTLREVARDASFATGAIVNNPYLRRLFRLSRGFDTYDYAPSDNRTIRRADEVADLALEWIDRTGGRRFVLLVHMMDQHILYDPPEQLRQIVSVTSTRPGWATRSPEASV